MIVKVLPAFTKEKDVLKAVLDYLKIKRIFHWRNNTGALKTENRFIRFGSVGSPDVFALRDGIIYGVEVKGTNGTQSEGQAAWQEEFAANGGTYILVKSIDDLKILDA